MNKAFYTACVASIAAGFCLSMAVLLATDGGKQSVFDGWMPVKAAILVLCILVGIALPVIVEIAIHRTP